MSTLLRIVEVSFKSGFIFLMLYTFKLMEDILPPLKNMIFMATSWQILLVIIYLLISMIWKNSIHKTSKYDLYFGILHVNALFIALGVTLLFWSGYIVAKYILKKDQIVMNSIAVPVIYLHLQHTLPLIILLIDLFLFKNYNHQLHKQGVYKYVIYALTSTITYMITVYMAHYVTKQIQGEIFWPYPFMKTFTDIQYMVFCGVMLAPLSVLCGIQRYFHLWIVKDLRKQKSS